VYVFGIYCRKRERGTGNDIITAAIKNARYVNVFFTIPRIDEKLVLLFTSFIAGCGEIKGSPPPVTIGAKLVVCWTGAFPNKSAKLVAPSAIYLFNIILFTLKISRVILKTLTTRS